jgi:hypothetical protein
MFRSITILVVLIWGLSSFESANAIDFSFAKWELVKKTDGISVYKWKPVNSNLYAAKANGVIFAPLERIASVLADGTRRKEWFPELIKTRVVRHISPLLRIEYMSVRTPFPVLNRDFVYAGEVTCKGDLSYMKVRFTSLDDPDVPETDFVRGRFIESSYTLRKLSEYRLSSTRWKFPSSISVRVSFTNSIKSA